MRSRHRGTGGLRGSLWPRNVQNTEICTGFFRTGLRSSDIRQHSGSLLSDVRVTSPIIIGGGGFRSRRSPPTGCLRQWFRCTCVQENLSKIKHVKVPCDSVMSRFYCTHYSSYSFEVLGKRTWNAIALTSRQPLLLPSSTVRLLQLHIQFPHKQQRNVPFLKYFHNRNAWTSTDWTRSPISLARYKKHLTLPKNKNTPYSTGVLTISLLYVTALHSHD